MSGNIQASDMQQQVLTEKKVANVYLEESDGLSFCVTENGITIEPDTVVVDDRFAYMSFRISGYHVEDGMEPGFETVNVYQGDNPEDEGAWVNMSGAMYNGIIPDENGAPVYDDGTSVQCILILKIWELFQKQSLLRVWRKTGIWKSFFPM